MTPERSNLEAVRAFFASMRAGAEPTVLADFYDFRDGKIVAQRNYDCFYPW